MQQSVSNSLTRAVPRKMLKQIARNGHVYSHSSTLQDITKAGGKPLFDLTGVNKASVLPLFCSEHDNKVFDPLEKYDFTGTPEQCFLLGYRAVCNEYLKKRRQRDGVAFAKTLDRGKNVQQQMQIQATMSLYERGVEAGFLDIERQKLEFDKALAERDFSRLHAYVITFDTVPQLLASGTLSPECDFDGDTLQNLDAQDARLDMITHSLIATRTGGAFVFAWLDISDEASRSLARSLDRVQNDKIANTVLRFVFEFCENHYANPDWWERLDEAVKKALLDRFAISGDTTIPRVHATCLTNDEVSPLDWRVMARNWTLFPAA
jgi:hypothetical protein